MSGKAITIVAALLIGNCMAQSPSSPAVPQHTHRREMPGGERSMKGCLSKDASGDYFLTLSRGRTVHLTASPDVTSHVGQQVRINGAFIDAPEGETKPASAANDPQPGASGKQHPIREFRVVKVDVLAASCPVAPVRK